MIIATVTAIMFLLNGHAGSFSFDIFSAGVEKNITDKARVKQIEKVLEEADDMVEAHNKSLKKASKKLLKLTTAYTTTRQDLDDFITRIDRDEAVFEDRLIQQRMKFTRLVTKDEWNATYAQTRSGQ